MKRNSTRIKTDIPLWDGHAAERVVDSLFQQKNQTHDRNIDIE